MKIQIDISGPFQILYTKSRRRSRTLSPDYKVREQERGRSSTSTHTSKSRLRASPSPMRETVVYDSRQPEQRGRSPHIEIHYAPSPRSHSRVIKESRVSAKVASGHRYDAPVPSSRIPPHNLADRQGRGRQRSYSNVERGQILRPILKVPGTPSRGRSHSRVRFSNTEYIIPPPPIIAPESQERRVEHSGSSSTSKPLPRSPQQVPFIPPRAPTSSTENRREKGYVYSSERASQDYNRGYVYPSSPQHGSTSSARHRTYDNLAYHPLQAKSQIL